MKNLQTENYNDFIHYINQEMAMYDDLLRNEPLKKDRENSLSAWKALNESKKEFIKIYSK
jgi:hypothetical protein